jgi:hypothetical protein
VRLYLSVSFFAFILHCGLCLKIHAYESCPVELPANAAAKMAWVSIMTTRSGYTMRYQGGDI